MRGLEVRAGMADGWYSASGRSTTGYYFGAAMSRYAGRANKWVFGAEYQPSAMPARTSSPRIPGRVRWAWASGAKARPRASDSSNANRFMLFDL